MQRAAGPARPAQPGRKRKKAATLAATSAQKASHGASRMCNGRCASVSPETVSGGGVAGDGESFMQDCGEG